MRFYLMSGFPGREARDPTGLELGIALALTLGLCGLATLVPYRAASRRLDA